MKNTIVRFRIEKSLRTDINFLLQKNKTENISELMRNLIRKECGYNVYKQKTKI